MRAARLLGTVLGPVLALAVLLAPGARASFGFLPATEGFDVGATEENGALDNQASSHPYALTTEVNFKPAQGGRFSEGDVRDLSLDLPPGLIENPTVAAKCSQAEFNTPRQSPYETPSLSGESCPDRSQIGVLSLDSSFAGGGTRSFGIFNLSPPPGAPSELGANPYGSPIVFVPHIRETGAEYGLTLNATNIPQLVDVKGFEMTIWGTPWVAGHDEQRGNCLNEADPAAFFAKCSAGPIAEFPPRAYLTLPASCAGPLAFSLSADSWQDPTSRRQSIFTHYNQGAPLSLGGCGAVPFEPEPSGQVIDPRASSATGYDFNIENDEAGVLGRKRLAPSQAKKAVVALPEGMTINPSVAAGLGVCTPAGYAAETVGSPPGAGCPNDSKIGDFTVKSPLFEAPIAGALFLAQPDQNPFGSLLALYLVAKDPERGFMVKVAGRLDADPHTGRLTATFDDLPQLPYSLLNVHFREGQRAPLTTPAACGHFATRIALSPWLDPAATTSRSSEFTIAAGIGGGPCPSSGPAPFAPGANAGTLNSNAGSYTPFYLHLTRTDAEQEITSYSAKLAPGLLGKVAGVPYCPEAAIEAAKGMSGVQSERHPACPAASEIGHTYSGYGLGPVLAYAPGGLYLAGPYHGSPLSVVAIDSATVGPFDLGTIVIRSAIKVDPQSARVSIDSSGSDPIPHIIDGIPLHLRDVRVYIDRPGFTLNPTSCDPFSVTSTLTGSTAPFADPKSATATAPVPFQASNCSALGFAPKLNMKLRGPTGRGGFPALRAVVTPRPGDANIGAAAVTLPATEFLAQEHIDTLCTRVQFAREACPAGSAYGRARAFTPLLSQPMEGPVYLRSSSNPLPDLVAALHGQGVAIEVVGRIDSVHGGLRGSFEALPDAPVSKFVFSLNGGKNGILVNEKSLCAFPQLATARFLGQDNQGELIHPRLGAECAKGQRQSRRGAK